MDRTPQNLMHMLCNFVHLSWVQEGGQFSCPFTTSSLFIAFSRSSSRVAMSSVKPVVLCLAGGVGRWRSGGRMTSRFTDGILFLPAFMALRRVSVPIRSFSCTSLAALSCDCVRRAAPALSCDCAAAAALSCDCADAGCVDAGGWDVIHLDIAMDARC
jgi:hypothetical protein